MSYLAMEFIDGVGLERVIAQAGRLPLERAADLGAQVADALDFAHKHNVVHRDIKPANIMIEAGDRVKVTDFGIAKVTDSADHLTMTGSLLGTPSYMSPEQARGAALDGRSDLFAVGCVLYEMLAGKKAFRGESITGLIFKIITEEPPPIRELGGRAGGDGPHHRQGAREGPRGALPDGPRARGRPARSHPWRHQPDDPAGRRRHRARFRALQSADRRGHADRGLAIADRLRGPHRGLPRPARRAAGSRCQRAAAAPAWTGRRTACPRASGAAPAAHVVVEHGTARRRRDRRPLPAGGGGGRRMVGVPPPHGRRSGLRHRGRNRPRRPGVDVGIDDRRSDGHGGGGPRRRGAPGRNGHLDGARGHGRHRGGGRDHHSRDERRPAGGRARAPAAGGPPRRTADAGTTSAPEARPVAPATAGRPPPGATSPSSTRSRRR